MPPALGANIQWMVNINTTGTATFHCSQLPRHSGKKVNTHTKMMPNCHCEHDSAKYRKIKLNARLMGQLRLVIFSPHTFQRDKKTHLHQGQQRAIHCVSKIEYSATPISMPLGFTFYSIDIKFWLDFTAFYPRGPCLTDSIIQTPLPPSSAGDTGIATFFYRKILMTCTS